MKLISVYFCENTIMIFKNKCINFSLPDKVFLVVPSSITTVDLSF